MKHLSKIRKILVGALLAVSVMMFTIGFSACGDNKGKAPELIGFDVGDAITVDQYKLVSPKVVHVTDKDGKMYDVVVTVKDSKGNIVFTDEGNKFNANDANGYTVIYSIDTWTFSVSKEVKVNVNASEDKFDFEVKYDSLVAVGDTVTVNVSGSMTNPQYSLDVTNIATGNDVPTDGLTFTPTEIGVHTVRVAVNAAEGSASKEFNIYVRKALQEGEVESFGTDWATVREYDSRKFSIEGEWSVKTTEETGIKDADGNDGTFAMLETDREYTHIYFAVRESRAYYRDLAMKGYTHVRFRVYVDSAVNNAKLFNWEHNSTNAYRTSLGSAKSGVWTEYYIPLTAGVGSSSDKKPGFVDSYDYYKGTWILLIDNSDGDWNTNGRDKDNDGNPINFKVYFDDVVAVRNVYEISENTTLDNDVYNIDSMLNRAWGTQAGDYKYTITKYTNYDTVQKKLVDNQTLTAGKTVNLSALPGNNNEAYGSYEIVYKLTNSDSAEPYQRVWIDVLDDTQHLYANLDTHNFTNSCGVIWRYADSSATVKANSNGTVTYTTRGLWGAGLQIRPSYSLQYYKDLQTAGYTALTFDLKMDVTFAAGVSETVKNTTFEICPMVETGHGISFKNGETHTVTVTIDKIIQYYNNLCGRGQGSNPNTDWYGKYALFFMNYNDKVYSNTNHESMTFTLSNLQMVKPAA